MKTRKLLFVALALIICLACLFVSCGKDDEPADGTTIPTQTTENNDSSSEENTTEEEVTTEDDTSSEVTTTPDSSEDPAESTTEEELPPFVVDEGDFHLDGGKIIGPDGNEFVPFGTNVNGPHCWGDRETTQDIDLMVNTWNYNCVRLVTMVSDIGFYGGHKGSPNDDLDKIVKAFTDRKIVVMIEQHDFTGKYPTDSTIPTLKQFATAWEQIAEKYKDNTYVWFNIMNEPGNGSGTPTPTAWKETHETVIKAIRGTGANNIIVCDGHRWAQEIGNSGDGDVTSRDSCILKYGPDLLKYGNIMFDLHMYSWAYQPTKLLNFVDSIHNAGMAVMCGEVGVGYADYTIDSANVMGTICALTALYEKNIGFLHWAWQDKSLAFTLDDTIEYGSWEATFKDGEPQNLSWIGQKVWNAAQWMAGKAEPESLTDVEATIKMIVADREIGASTKTSRFVVTVANTGDKSISKNMFTIKLLVNGEEVDTYTNDKFMPLQKYYSFESKPIDLPEGEFTVKAVIEGVAIPDEEGEPTDEKYPISDELEVSFSRAPKYIVEEVKASVTEGQTVAARDELNIEATVKNNGMPAADFKKLSGSFFWNGEFVSLGQATEVTDNSITFKSTRKFPVTDLDIYLTFKITGTEGGDNSAVYSITEFEGLSEADFGILPWGGFDTDMTYESLGSKNWVAFDGYEFQFWGQNEAYIKDGILVVEPSTDAGTGCALWLRKNEISSGASYTLVVGAKLAEDAVKDPDTGKFVSGTMEVGIKWKVGADWIQKAVSVTSATQIDYRLDVDIPADADPSQYYIFVWINGGTTKGYIDYITMLEK